MSPPRVDLIRAIISRDSSKSCRKEQRQSSRGGMHWGKPQHSQSAVMRGWTGIGESCLDAHPYKGHMNLVLSLSSNFSVSPLTSHLRSPEVKGHPPIHSKALLPSPPHCIFQGAKSFYTPVQLEGSLWQLSSQEGQLPLTQEDSRSDWVRRQDSTIGRSALRSRVDRRWLCLMINNLFTALSIKKQGSLQESCSR